MGCAVSSYVPRTKNDLLRGRDNSSHDSYREVTLTCGHDAAGAPALLSPDRWFCGECRAFAAAKAARKRAA